MKLNYKANWITPATRSSLSRRGLTASTVGIYREEDFATASRIVMYPVTVLYLLLCAAPREAVAQNAASYLGFFESHSDVGEVLHARSVEYDAAAQLHSNRQWS
jgi:hypothetical protein